MHRTAKFRRSLFILLLFLLVISGCGSKRPLLSQPVQTLSCVETTSAPTILPHESGKFLICWTDYEKDATCLRVIDIAADKITASYDLPGYWEIQGGPFADGSYALFNWNDYTWKFIGADLSAGDAFSQQQPGGIFSHDRSSYYFLQDNVLCRTDMTSGETGRVSLEADMRFSSLDAISPDSDTLVLHCLLSPYGYESGTAALDPDTGIYSLLQEDFFYPPAFGGDGTLRLMRFNDGTMVSDLLYTDDGGICRLVGADVVGGVENELIPVNGSPYLLSAGQTAELFRLDETIASYPLSADVPDGTPYDLNWLPSEQIMVGFSYDQRAFHLFAVDPAQLTFTESDTTPKAISPLSVDTGLAQRYWSELKGPSLPEELHAARQYADRLEERYGVTILLSAQAESACNLVGDAVITTTDKASMDNEPQAITHMLEALDQTLALYPADFFRQLRNSMGEGGVRFMPVAHIENAVNAVGLTYETDGGWQNIAVDVRLDGFDWVICHELWHATENVIMDRHPECLDPVQWAQYNPPGFRYQDQLEHPDPDSWRWTFFQSDSENVYFVDDYSRTNSGEDRARIMEYIMANDDYAGPLMQCPAIVQKLQFMCQAVRASFDTSSWGTPRWERLLNE